MRAVRPELLRNVLLVLVHKRAGALLKLGAIRFGPPVVERPAGIVLGTLIVEAVPDLVADHGADPTVVERIVALGIKEREL